MLSSNLDNCNAQMIAQGCESHQRIVELAIEHLIIESLVAEHEKVILVKINYLTEDKTEVEEFKLRDGRMICRITESSKKANITLRNLTFESNRVKIWFVSNVNGGIIYKGIIEFQCENDVLYFGKINYLSEVE